MQDFETTQFTAGEQTQYSCNSDYALQTRETTADAKCRPDGTWDFPTPCVRVCGNPPSGDLNSHLVNSDPAPYIPGSRAYYACNSDHNQETDLHKECNSNGGWDNRAVCCPTCRNFEDNQCKIDLLEGCGEDLVDDLWGKLGR